MSGEVNRSQWVRYTVFWFLWSRKKGLSCAFLPYSFVCVIIWSLLVCLLSAAFTPDVSDSSHWCLCMHSTQSVTVSKDHARTDVTLNMHITPYTNLPLKLSLFVKVRDIASDFTDSIPSTRIHCAPAFSSCFFYSRLNVFLLVIDLPQRNCMEGIGIVTIS